MNLLETINVYAGGPGSGCTGPNCGRPTSGKAIEPGDTVRLKVPVKLFNKKNGNNEVIPNAKAKVVAVLPKVGNAEQIVKINIIAPTKKHESEEQHIKMFDIELHKSGLTHQVSPGENPQNLPLYTDKTFHPTVPAWKKYDLQPVPKNEVQVKFKTPDGATVTVIKPQGEHEQSIKTLKEIASTPSTFKGRFQMVTKTGGVDQITRIFDTSRSSLAHEREASGQVVYVHRYKDKVVVVEQTYVKWSQKVNTTNFSYKNVGSAMGMLNKRYGIRIPVKGGF